MLFLKCPLTIEFGTLTLVTLDCKSSVLAITALLPDNGIASKHSFNQITLILYNQYTKFTKCLFFMVCLTLSFLPSWFVSSKALFS